MGALEGGRFYLVRGNQLGEGERGGGKWGRPCQRKACRGGGGINCVMETSSEGEAIL